MTVKLPTPGERVALATDCLFAALLLAASVMFVIACAVFWIALIVLNFAGECIARGWAHGEMTELPDTEES